MANTIARATGYDRTGRSKEVHRLGSSHSSAEAATWVTFANVTVRADGSGVFELRRNGQVIRILTWEPE